MFPYFLMLAPLPLLPGSAAAGATAGGAADA